MLGWIERRGNQLPDPVFLFLWLILFLVIVSVVANLVGLSAAHPTEIDPQTGGKRVIFATSLLSALGIWVRVLLEPVVQLLLLLEEPLATVS